jgi:endonuclease/exonuclease/phosphatase family metal-dependent hydrolase
MRAVTWNILDGGESREDAIVSTLHALDADIVVLQELFDNGLFDRIRTELGCEGLLGHAGGIRKVGLLTRLPIQAISTHTREPMRRGAVVADLKLPNDWDLRVIGVHKKAELTVEAERWRTREADAVIERLVKPAPGEVMVTGDFNSLAPGDRASVRSRPLLLRLRYWWQMRKMPRSSMSAYAKAGLVDAFRSLHPPTQPGWTLPADNPTVRLDYALLSPGLRSALQRCRVVDDLPGIRHTSDHLPVLTEFF